MNTNMRYIMNNFWKHIFAISGGELSRTARYWKFILTMIFTFGLMAAIGCNQQINVWSGAGTDPDNESPILTVLSPRNMDYVGAAFILTGTATDNVGIANVTIQFFRNEDDGSQTLIYTSKAILNNEKWSCKIKDVLDSGEYTVVITANDVSANRSYSSSKTLVLIVDASLPKANITAPLLLTQNELENLDYRDYTHIEYFQNKSFTVRGSVEDDYPINDITVILTEANNGNEDTVYQCYFDNESFSESNAGNIKGSMYNWNMTINSMENVSSGNESSSQSYINKLKNLDPTKKHYLKTTIIIHDKAGNESICYGKTNHYLCLYQEADRPWTQISSLSAELTQQQQEEFALLSNETDKHAFITSSQQLNNKLHSAAPISAIAFDDDGLSTIEYKIIKNGITPTLIEYKKITTEDFGQAPCTSWQVVAPSITGLYQLYYRITDIHEVPSFGDDAHDWTNDAGWSEDFSIGFQVIDESAPSTEILQMDEYPESAYIDKSPNQSFVIEGTTKDGAGLSAIILAWDPSADITNNTILKTTKWDVTEDGWADGANSTRIRYWIVNSSYIQESSANSTITSRWSYTIPINDFLLESGTAIYSFKKMYYCAVSKSGTFGSGTFNIPKDYNPPTLHITEPENGATRTNVENARFTISGDTADAESGVRSLQAEYLNIEGKKLYCDITPNEDGTWSIRSDKLVGLAGGYQKITIYSWDKFGNFNTDSISLKVDDDSPMVNSVDVLEEGNYYSTGATFHFSVTMSRPVEISYSSGSPNIKLKLNCNEDAYAVYTGLTNSLVLNFTYTVKDGDQNDAPLDYSSVSSIILGSGTKVIGKAEEGQTSTVGASLILPAEPGESGSLASRGIYIDTQKPKITSFSYSTETTGRSAYKAGDILTITANFNENVSGQAKIKLNSSSLKIQSEELTDFNDTLKFTYTVQDGDNVNILDIVSMEAFSNAVTIRDKAGNPADIAHCPKGSNEGSLASLLICIDTSKPSFENVIVTSITGNMKNNIYYLNENKIVKAEVHFNENMMLGTQIPKLTLNAENGGTPAVATYTGGEGSSILRFEYIISSGDNSISSTDYLKAVSLDGDIKDKAGNEINGSSNDVKTINIPLEYSSKKIIIDTTAPTAATISFQDSNANDVTNTFTHNNSTHTYTGQNNGYTSNLTLTASMALGESTAKIRMNAQCGGTTILNWNDETNGNNQYTTITNNAEENWIIKVQPEDYAGNKAPVTTASFTVDNGVPLLSAVTTNKPDGIYKKDDVLEINLIFSKEVTNTSPVTLTFNNGGQAVFAASGAGEYKKTYIGEYTVGHGGDSDMTADTGLKITSITGGSFRDKTGNTVNSNSNYNLASASDDFKTKTIKIDRTIPTVTGFRIYSLSDETHSDSNHYYINQEDTAVIAVSFSESVNIFEDSVLTLMNGKDAIYCGSENNGQILKYSYTVSNGDDCIDLSADITKANKLKVADLAGNLLSAVIPTNELKFKNKKIIVDTENPISPTITVKKKNNEIVASMSSVSEQLNLFVTGETNAILEYSKNNGAQYDLYTDSVPLGISGNDTTYDIIAIQTDIAGNSSPTSKFTVNVNLKDMGISQITTTKANGKYKTGDRIPIIVMFTQKVAVSNLILTLKNDTIQNVIQTTPYTGGLARSHTIEYTIVEGHNCDKLTVTNITGNFTNESGNLVNDRIASSFDSLIENFKQNQITIDTTAPEITNITIDSIADSNGELHYTNDSYYLNNGDKVILKITFSEPVIQVGTSAILLNSGETAICTSSGKLTEHTYEYTVESGNSSSLGINNAAAENIQDEAGNHLSLRFTKNNLRYNSKTVVIDTNPPTYPVVTIKDNSNDTEIVNDKASCASEIKIIISPNGETNTSIYYTLDGGATEYKKYTSEVITNNPNKQTLYKINAKQTDLAGNESVTTVTKSITTDLRPIGLIGITTTKKGGTYKSGEKIPLMIEFHKAVYVQNGILTLNNGATVPFKVTDKTNVIVNYIVGSNASFSTDRLYAKEISGTFKDTATNSLVSSFNNVSGTVTNGVVNGTIYAEAENLPAAGSSDTIIIDTIAPTITAITLTGISDDDHLYGSYYLNAGDTVSIAVRMSKKVTIPASSTLTLSNNAKASYSSISNDEMTLTYLYTVGSSGTDATSLSVKSGAYPNNVTDKAGNPLTEGLNADTLLQYNSKNIVIDTQCPAPTVTVTNNDGSAISSGSTNKQIKITIAGSADMVSSEYSIDAGASYNPYTAAVTIGESGELKTYKILARQTDKAGNLSPASTIQTITVDLRTMGLKSISTTKMGGIYKAGETIPIVLEFNKATTVTDGVLTLNNGATKSFSFTNKTSYTANYIIDESDTSIAALKVTNFAGTIKDPSVGNAFVTSFENIGGSVSNGAVSGAIGSITNLPASGANAVGVDTVKPTIAASGIAFSSSTGVLRGGKYYCKAGTTVTISIEMSEEVTVTGSSTLALSNGAKASYDSISNDKKTLYYIYTVASGDTNTTALKVNTNTFPDNVTDQAGNPLSSGLSSASNISNVIIDTQCNMPTMTLSPDIADKGTTDNTVDLTFFNNGETNATINYTIDGGSHTSDYSTPIKLTNPDEKKTYQIMAYQTDIAGNVSARTAMLTLTIDMRVLKLKSISTTKVAGTYKEGEVIPLTLTFTKNVTITNGQLTLNTNNTTSTFTCSNASTVSTTYTVQDGDNTEELKVTTISGIIKDVDAGNITADNSELYRSMPPANNINTVIKLDTTAPNVTGYSVTATSAAAANKSGTVYYLNAGKTVTIKMTTNEAVNVTGSSVLSLSNGGKAVYSSGTGSTTLTYIYTVGSSDTNAALSVAANAKPTFVTDTAGNALTSSQSAITLKDSSSNTFTVDTKCNAPTMSGITAGSVYKTAPTVTVSGTETGASLRYSKDGGATNATFTGASFTPTLSGDGTYQITVQQTDIAGNTSVWATPISVIYDAVAPTVKSISTTKANGTYGLDEKIEITAEFSEAVSGSITVNLNTNATVTLSPSSATTASASYTVAEGQNADPLKVSTVTGTVTDAAGNPTTSHSIGSITNFSGKSIKIDTNKPTLSKYSIYKYNTSTTTTVTPTAGSTSYQDATVSKDKPITLTFSEPVIKGSGTIKIERVYKSYPAVLSADDYQSHKAGIGDYYIQRCIGTVGNDGVTPDTNAKYVLKYEIDHKAWASEPASGSEKTVYDYFKDLDYNVMTLDITSGLITVSGQNVTITPSSALANGIVYKVVISAGAFIDAAGNSCAADSSVQFETGPTATPVIRINKLSGKEGGSQPTSTGVKISTETYGGTIYYQSKYKETANDTEIITISQVTNPSPATTGTTDKYIATLSNTSTSAAIFKLYAKTVKDNLTTTDNNITKELAFKTVIIGGSYGFRGSDSTGGISATTEFPLNWYDTPNTAQSDGNKMYSWHILKDFQAKSMKGSDDWLSVGAANTACYVGNYNVTALTYTLNVLDYTFNDSAEVSIWAWDERNNGDWYDVTKVNDTQGTVVVAKGLSKFKLVRCSSNHPHDWNNVWNQTGDITITSATTYTATF